MAPVIDALDAFGECPIARTCVKSMIRMVWDKTT
jgi:hypothetical protein